MEEIGTMIQIQTVNFIIFLISVLALIILTIMMVRDKNKPVGYRFTEPDESTTDNDEDENLDKK